MNVGLPPWFQPGENAEFAWHARRYLDESDSKPDLISGTPSAAKRYRSAD